MGKIVTILVAGVILIGGITLLAMNRVSVAFIGRCVDQHDRTCARSNAISVANMAIGALARGEELQEVSNVPLFSTRVSLDTFALTENRIKIIARGYVPGKDTAVVEAIVNLSASSLSFDMRAAVVAQCKLTVEKDLIIDGRNHDMEGGFIAETGTLAVSTIETFEAKKKSKIGGTCGEEDHEPEEHYTSCIVEEEAVWPNGFPDTPDKVFGGEEAGFPEGRLKEIAQSGVDGSQYVTDPANLTWPLQALTYVELPSGGKWNNIDFRESWGILVVHNSQTNAQMEKLKEGRFRGILIVDKIKTIENKIIGGVTLLTQASSTWKGKKNKSEIYFGREAIERALTVLQQEGSENPLVVSWYE